MTWQLLHLESYQINRLEQTRHEDHQGGVLLLLLRITRNSQCSPLHAGKRGRRRRLWSELPIREDPTLWFWTGGSGQHDF